MAQLDINLFSTFSVAHNGDPITDFATDKVRALCAYLAVENQRPHPRSQLAALLWPDYPNSDALRNLRQSLYRLGTAIDRVVPGHFDHLFAVTRQSVAMRAVGVTVDVLDFETLMDEAAVGASTPAGRDERWLTAMEKAVGLYRGEFLAGLQVNDASPFEEWQIVQRERYHQRALLALHEVATVLGSAGAYEKMHHYAERQLALEPWREEAHQQVMRALALRGERSAALDTFERCRRVLAQELGVEPSTETKALYDAILSGKVGPAPHSPVPVADGPVFASQSPVVHRPTKLPMVYTPILGREQETADVIRFLSSGQAKLVTLVGPGGVGKTRLAVEIAQQIAQQPTDFAGGIWYVGLTSVDDPAKLASTISTELGLPGTSQTTPIGQLCDYLREKEALLILDGFEHLMVAPEPPIDLLDQIMGAAPNLRLLITSREALNLRAEQRFLVAGLTHQPDDSPSPAASLFIQAAKRIRPNFAPNAKDEVAVERIGRMVLGLPLALEIAASWVRLYPPDFIADEIARSLDFLASPLRDMPTRHRSVRAVFDHSWRLLTRAEQQLLARAAIFRGGFTMAAALWITQSSVIEIAALLDKSLLRRISDDRYELHDMVRQYALEKLNQEMGVSQTEQRHTEFYLGLAAQQAPGFHGPEPQKALNSLQVEIDNLRGAWQRATTAGQANLLEQGGAGLAYFFEFANLFQEGEAAFGLAAERAFGLGEAEVQAQMRAFQADFLVQLGERSAAARLLRSALDHANTPPTRARIQSLLGHVLQLQGDQSEAVAQQQAALDHFLLAQPGWELALCHERFGGVYRALGDLDRAMESYQRALAIDESIGNGVGIARHETSLGNVHTYRGQYEAGLACFERALVVHRALGNQIGIATQLTRIGRIHWELSDFERALPTYQEALALLTPLGDRVGLADLQSKIGGVYFEQGQYSLAKSHFEEALRLDRATNNRAGVGLHTGNLGVLHWKQEEFAEAERLYREALGLCQSIGDQAGVALWLSNLSNLFYDTGEYAEALALGEQAEAIFRNLGNKFYLGGRLIHTAMVLFELGRYAEARQKNDEGLGLVGKLQRRSRLFPGKVLAAKLDGIEGKTEEACGQLLALLQQAHDIIEQAVLHYALWQATGKLEHARQALELYTALFQRTSLPSYQAHRDELSRVLAG